MNKRLMVVVSIAAMSVLSLAWADEAAKPGAASKTAAGAQGQTVTGEVKVMVEGEAKKSPPGEVKVRVLSFRKGIKINSDGTVEVRSIDASNAKQTAPEVKMLVKGLVEREKQEAANPASDGVSLKGEVRLIIVGPDGKIKEMVVPLKAGDVKTPGPGLAIEILPALKASGINLPEEAKRAIQAAEEARKSGAKMRIAIELKKQEVQKAAEQLRKTAESLATGARPAAKPCDEVHAKLDKILARLDAMEKDIKSLRTQGQK